MSDWLKNIRFDRDCANPIAAQLSIMLKRLIVDGRIETGSRLPSSRLLTKSLGIAYKNVDKEILQRKGLDVPDDISVTGFNNYDVSYVSSPTITTVAVPMWEIGRMAGHKLHNLINGYYESNETYLPVELVVRESTGQALDMNASTHSKQTGSPYEKHKSKAS